MVVECTSANFATHYVAMCDNVRHDGAYGGGLHRTETALGLQSFLPVGQAGR